MEKPIGLTFTLNKEVVILQPKDCVITPNGKISKKYVKTLLSIENGKKIYGYIKPIIKDNYICGYGIYPKEFERAVTLLSSLNIETSLIDEEPRKKTKGKYIIVNLTSEQEAQINELKALCE